MSDIVDTAAQAMRAAMNTFLPGKPIDPKAVTEADRIVARAMVAAVLNDVVAIVRPEGDSPDPITDDLADWVAYQERENLAARIQNLVASIVS